MVFHAIRKIAVAVLVVAIASFAFLAILSIWEVLSEDDVYKSLTSMAIIAFAGFLVVLISLEREGKLSALTSGGGKNFSLSRVLIFSLIGLFVIFYFFRALFLGSGFYR